MNERGRAGRAVVWGGVLAVVVTVATTVTWCSGRPGDTTPPLVGDRQHVHSPTAPRPLQGPGSEAGAGVVAVERQIAPAGAVLQTLRVVDEHGAPVAGAEVAVAASVPTERLSRDVEVAFEGAPRLLSATDGTVSWRAAEPTRFALARQGGRFGCRELSFDAAEPVPELVIAVDRTLHVRVIGPDGAPRADVPVWIGWLRFAGLRFDGGGGERARSDARGRITVWHAQALDHWQGADPVVYLTPEVFGAEVAAVAVPLREAMPDPIDVLCPAFGSLRIEASSVDGARLPAGFAFGLRAADGSEMGALEPVTTAMQDRSRVLVPIAVGRRWRIEAGGFTSTTVLGPTQDREEVVCRLVAAGDARLVTARLLGPDGIALVAHRVLVYQRLPLQTDDRGQIVFPAAGAGEPVRLDVPALHGGVTLTMPQARGGGVFDLGDVRLPAANLQARGVVVGGRRRENVGQAQLLMRNAATSMHTYCEPDGSFEVWDERPCDGDMALTVTADGYESSEIVVPCGSDDLRIELRPQPRLLATVLTDDDVTIDEMMVNLHRGDAGSRPFASWGRRGVSRFAFAISRSDPGIEAAVFEVLRDDGSPFPATLPHARWHATDEGYEATLDLRGTLEAVVVKPRVDGAEVRVRSWFVRFADGDGTWSDLGYGGRLGFLTWPGSTGETIVLGPYGFPVHAELVVGENVLDLPPPATIAVRAEGWPDDVRGTVCLCQLTWAEPLLDELAAADVLDADQRPRSPDTESQWFSPRSDVARPIGADMAFSVVCRGRYRLVPWVAHEDGARPLLDAAVDVEVTTPGQRLDVPLRVDADRVRAAGR